MNRTLWIGVAAIVLCGVLTAPAQQANSAESLLQAATKKELVDGNLAGAIEGYKQALAAAKGNRAVAAQILLQLGQCYRKQGNAEARLTFERLLREYGDQTAAAAKAREELAALPASEGKPTFTKIRVPTGLPSLSTFELSPDGRQLAYVSGGSVWLLPVHGPAGPGIAGQPRRITDPNPAWFRSYDVTWSRDGKWLAVYVEERPPQKPADWVTYVASSSGGTPRRVSLERLVGQKWSSEPALALSPDGEWLAYGGYVEGGDMWGTSIYRQPTSGGPSKTVAPPPALQPQYSPAYSPDGKWVAYVRRIQPPGARYPLGRQVWVADVAGGTAHLIYDLAAPGALRSPIWSPDGNMLALLVNPDGAGWEECGLLVLASIGPNGRPTGVVTKIELPQGTLKKLTGWSTDNKIGLVFQTPELTALYSVAASGGKAVQLTPNTAWMPAWSPDGKRIYFAGLHHGESATLEYVSGTGGPVGAISVSGPKPMPRYPSSISVSPDGQKLLFQSVETDGKHFFTIPTEGGTMTGLAMGTGNGSHPQWSPDGKQIAFVSYENIHIMPAEGGQPRRLTSAADSAMNAQVAWSPNGRYLAYQSTDNKIRLLSVEGGNTRVLVDGLEGYRPASGLAWSPDGRELAYVTGGRIWRVNIETGNREQVQTGLNAVHLQIAWSPDGKTIAFNALQGGEPELWLLEDFLPLVKAKR